jgi:hypothetical protein
MEPEMKVVQRLVAVLVLSSLGTSLSWGAEPQTSLLIRLPQETVKSGSNVEVDITIKNISGKAMQIAIPVGNVEREFELFVTDENGRSPAYTEWGVRIHGPKKYVGTVNSIVSGVLQPGQTVNEFFFR